MRITRTAILLFVAAVALGPLYTVDGYSPVSNVISELAAQNTPRGYIMAIAFVLMGASVVVEGATAFRRSLIPFMAFGLFFGAAGLFGHRPIAPGWSYSEWVDATHSGLATASGIALTIGFAWQAVLARETIYRWTAGTLALACVGMPLLMLWQPSFQGVVQRAMYSMVFGWLWAYYPSRTHV